MEGGDSCMGTIDDLKEKIEGEADKIKGQFQGGIKGGVSKIKGNIKSSDADARLQERNSETNDNRDTDWSDDTL